jgi:hypothetical protein
VSDVEPRPDRFETGLVVVPYVVPLTLTVVFLAVVGLPGLALALLAVEAFVTASVVVAKRPEGSARRPGPLVLGLALVGVAAAAGAGALLT